jgi:hypothetical protein
MLLTAADKFVGHKLIDWDRNRVQKHAANGFDCSAYSTRIDLAEACLDIDENNWPQEVRFLFMALLEVLRAGTKARAQNIGPESYPVPNLSTQERDALKQFAKDIGVINRLREVAPVQWSDSEAP